MPNGPAPNYAPGGLSYSPPPAGTSAPRAMACIAFESAANILNHHHRTLLQRSRSGGVCRLRAISNRGEHHG